jgi:putative oxidoreductase
MESVLDKRFQHLAPLFLRLIIGVGFMAHGWAKLSRGPAGFEKLLIQVGSPLPHFTSWLVPLTELLGGCAILVGALVVFISVPLMITMLVAMLTVNVHYGFSSIKTIGLTPQGPLFGPPGYEINLLYIAGLLSLMLTGAGTFSVDGYLGSRKKRPGNTVIKNK